MLNVSSKQARCVSNGVSQHRIQLRFGKFLKLSHNWLARRNADRAQCSQLKNNFDVFAQAVRKASRVATIEWDEGVLDVSTRPGSAAAN
jgi:hypothetical protein